MIILSLALSLVTPAHACAMPRYEAVAVKPAAPPAEDQKKLANAEKAAPRTLEDALADIDAAGIPELQNPTPAPLAQAPVPAPAPALVN